jgi:hypothetical protein
MDKNQVSAYRIFGHKKNLRQQNYVIYRAVQCHDYDGPQLPPDVFYGKDAGSWATKYRGIEYNGCLRKSNSVRKDGCHHAPGCHHYDVEDAAGMVWIIDPSMEHNIDVVIDVALMGLCMNQQLVLMIRNLMVLDNDEDRELEEHSCEWYENTPCRCIEPHHFPQQDVAKMCWLWYCTCKCR